MTKQIPWDPLKKKRPKRGLLEIPGARQYPQATGGVTQEWGPPPLSPTRMNQQAHLASAYGPPMGPHPFYAEPDFGGQREIPVGGSTFPQYAGARAASLGQPVLPQLPEGSTFNPTAIPSSFAGAQPPSSAEAPWNLPRNQPGAAQGDWEQFMDFQAQASPQSAPPMSSQDINRFMPQPAMEQGTWPPGPAAAGGLSPEDAERQAANEQDLQQQGRGTWDFLSPPGRTPADLEKEYLANWKAQTEQPGYLPPLDRVHTTGPYGVGQDVTGPGEPIPYNETPQRRMERELHERNLAAYRGAGGEPAYTREQNDAWLASQHPEAWARHLYGAQHSTAPWQSGRVPTGPNVRVPPLQPEPEEPINPLWGRHDLPQRLWAASSSPTTTPSEPGGMGRPVSLPPGREVDVMTPVGTAGDKTPWESYLRLARTRGQSAREGREPYQMPGWAGGSGQPSEPYHRATAAGEGGYTKSPQERQVAAKQARAETLATRQQNLRAKKAGVAPWVQATNERLQAGEELAEDQRLARFGPQQEQVDPEYQVIASIGQADPPLAAKMLKDKLARREGAEPAEPTGPTITTDPESGGKTVMLRDRNWFGRGLGEPQGVDVNAVVPMPSQPGKFLYKNRVFVEEKGAGGETMLVPEEQRPWAQVPIFSGGPTPVESMFPGIFAANWAKRQLGEGGLQNNLPYLVKALRAGVGEANKKLGGFGR